MKSFWVKLKDSDEDAIGLAVCNQLLPKRLEDGSMQMNSEIGVIWFREIDGELAPTSTDAPAFHSPDQLVALRVYQEEPLEISRLEIATRILAGLGKDALLGVDEDDSGDLEAKFVLAALRLADTLIEIEQTMDSDEQDDEIDEEELQQ